MGKTTLASVLSGGEGFKTGTGLAISSEGKTGTGLAISSEGKTGTDLAISSEGKTGTGLAISSEGKTGTGVAISSEGKIGTGLAISSWRLKHGLNDWRLHVNIWDMSEDPCNTTTCHCFLSEQSVCILLFNLKETTSWAEVMRTRVERISALVENIGTLKEAIWRCALRYPMDNGCLVTQLPANCTNLVCQVVKFWPPPPPPPSQLKKVVYAAGHNNVAMAPWAPGIIYGIMIGSVHV